MIYPKTKSDCQACELRRGCSGVITPIGSLTADILVVGSFPDDLSDLRGESFHPDGWDGQQLGHIREQMGLTWEQMRLTYAVACRPEEGQPPKPSITACRHWLKKEEMRMTCARLEAAEGWLKPDLHPVILGIGNVAAHALGLVPYGAPAIDVAGRWYGNVEPFRHNELFVLQGFETLREPVIPTIEVEWREHLAKLKQGLAFREIGYSYVEKTNLVELHKDPFIDNE